MWISANLDFLGRGDYKYLPCSVGLVRLRSPPSQGEGRGFESRTERHSLLRELQNHLRVPVDVLGLGFMHVSANWIGN